MSFVAEPILNQLSPLVFKTLVGIAITGLLGVFMWPFRRMKKEWVALKEEQSLIHEELVKQRTNCLTTLQSQGDRQIELLGDMSKSLNAIALSQAEMTGFCKANACAPTVRIRRASRKK